MLDFGVRIAKRGHGYEEADKNMIFNTKYPVLKLKASGEGNLAYTAGNGETIVTIPHNLGYVPICFVYGKYFDVDAEAVMNKYSVWNRYFYRGVQVADFYYYYVDSTNLYIAFLPAEGITDAYSFNVPYMYHIFYDEDTL